MFIYDSLDVVEVDLEDEEQDYIGWGLHAIMIREAWKKTKGEGVKIAILDTGVDYEHEDLKENIKECRDFTNSVKGPLDTNGHGTHVAGIIAATENKKGIVGVAPKAELYIAKVLKQNGGGSYKGIAKAIEWAIEKEVDIINMSFGASKEPPESFHKVIKKAHSHNIVMLGASGNENQEVSYPAAFDEVLGVGAINRQFNKADFSNFGIQNAIVAPGVDILSTYKDGKFARISGTSMATPIIAGSIALYLSALKKEKKSILVQDIYKDILNATIDLGKEGKDDEYGYGLINLSKLMQFS